MTTWNYRVFREADGGLSIRETFYDQAGKAVACGEPVASEAGSIVELMTLLDDQRQALAQPVLLLTDLPAPSPGKLRQRSGRRHSHAEVVSRLGLGPQG